MIAVTLLAVPRGYVGWQERIATGVAAELSSAAGRWCKSSRWASWNVNLR
jgi:hypothetical protein